MSGKGKCWPRERIGGGRAAVLADDVIGGEWFEAGPEACGVEGVQRAPREGGLDFQNRPGAGEVDAGDERAGIAGVEIGENGGVGGVGIAQGGLEGTGRGFVEEFVGPSSGGVLGLGVQDGDEVGRGLDDASGG